MLGPGLGTTPVTASAPADLHAIGAVPAHIVGLFEEPLGAQVLADERTLVFDRRAHAVFVIDAARTNAVKIVQIGQEAGRVIQPSAFDADPGGTFVVADAPNRRERIQVFDGEGKRVSGFTLPGRASARVTLGNLVLSGVGSLQYTGKTVLINEPETGGLVTEYSLSGYALRTIGRLRPTGHDDDRALHLALNAGLPLTAPDGGLYFVFLTGEPRFRRYDAKGQLTYERLVQGRDVDDLVASLPTVWPRRQVEDEELPLVTPTVRTAGVDRRGGLWIVLATGVTHRFDADGDRLATYRLRATGPLQPTSLHFTRSGRLLVTPGLFEFPVS